IQKQNVPASFISRHMRMTVQENIDTLRRPLRRNVLQPKLQPATREIDSQLPVEVAVAIPTHDHHRSTRRAQFIQNPFGTDIADVPDLVRPARKIDNLLRQLVVRIREDENLHRSANKVPLWKSSKHQHPSTREASISKLQTIAPRFLRIEAWDFLGAWCLGFGA